MSSDNLSISSGSSGVESSRTESPPTPQRAPSKASTAAMEKFEAGVRELVKDKGILNRVNAIHIATELLEGKAVTGQENLLPTAKKIVALYKECFSADTKQPEKKLLKEVITKLTHIADDLLDPSKAALKPSTSKLTSSPSFVKKSTSSSSPIPSNVTSKRVSISDAESSSIEEKSHSSKAEEKPAKKKGGLAAFGRRASQILFRDDKVISTASTPSIAKGSKDKGKEKFADQASSSSSAPSLRIEKPLIKAKEVKSAVKEHIETPDLNKKEYGDFTLDGWKQKLTFDISSKANIGQMSKDVHRYFYNDRIHVQGHDLAAMKQKLGLNEEDDDFNKLVCSLLLPTFAHLAGMTEKKEDEIVLTKATKNLITTYDNERPDRPTGKGKKSGNEELDTHNAVFITNLLNSDKANEKKLGFLLLSLNQTLLQDGANKLIDLCKIEPKFPLKIVGEQNEIALSTDEDNNIVTNYTVVVTDNANPKKPGKKFDITVSTKVKYNAEANPPENLNVEFSVKLSVNKKYKKDDQVKKLLGRLEATGITPEIVIK